MNTHHERANVLIEALPYIQRLSGKTIVVKYGGAAMLDDNLKKRFMEDITLLKFVGMNPIVVHGGGPDINGTLSALHIETKFHNGLRVTDEETMKVVQMVLTAGSTRISWRESMPAAARPLASAASTAMSSAPISALPWTASTWEAWGKSTPWIQNCSIC